jgi:hypothetical protein
VEIETRLRGTLSTVFNILSGKEGWRAAVCGWSAVASVGFAAISPPLFAVIDLAVAALSVQSSHDLAKRYDQGKSLTI